jgi:phosphoribosylglycinamide formyltransferase-1
LSDARPLRVVVLVSGEGTNLQALIDAAARPDAPYKIVAVASDKRDARGLARARTAGIAAVHVDPRSHTDRSAFDRSLADAITNYSPDLVVLAGFMRILSGEFVARFEGRMLNIHPSLLPKFKGLDTHRRVIEAAEREHGATVHFVTAELDGGPPVIQYRIEIDDGDNEDSLSARVHAGEYIILPRAVQLVAAGRLRCDDGIVIIDGERQTEPIRIDEQRA